MQKRQHRRSGFLGASLRRLRLQARRINRALPLARRFLLLGLVVMVSAMALLGATIGYYLQSSIAQGVASSAADSIDSFIAHELRDVDPRLNLSDDQRRRLDETFHIVSDMASSRLLLLRIWTLSGALLYQSPGGFRDRYRPEAFEQARRGYVSSSIEHIPLEPVGPLGSPSLAVLRIYLPLHRAQDGEIFAVAALYYNAQSLLAIQARTQVHVWLVVGLVGLVVLGLLYIIVERASRTILVQRARLAANLSASRRLLEENNALHAAAERVRLNANFANERLLARVGSDIHDGPLQLLTLVILRLLRAAATAQKRGRKTAAAELRTTIQLATETMEELRNISAGLVLPELAPLSPEQAIALAIVRHEEATGAAVRRELGELPPTASMAAKICAYRVVQEALTNAFRHGGGSDAVVSATASAGRIRVSIANPSRGSGSGGGSGEEAPGGLGLAGMRFRVESLGGVLSADIAGSDGMARVAAEIPCGPEE